MKKYLIILALFIASCGHCGPDKRLNYDRNYTIVKMGQSTDFVGKFNTPVVRKLVLARSIIDTTMFVEWQLTDTGFYNKHIGDTLKFKYISKDREFKIR